MSRKPLFSTPRSLQPKPREGSIDLITLDKDVRNYFYDLSEDGFIAMAGRYRPKPSKRRPLHDPNKGRVTAAEMTIKYFSVLTYRTGHKGPLLHNRSGRPGELHMYFFPTIERLAMFHDFLGPQIEMEVWEVLQVDALVLTKPPTTSDGQKLTFVVNPHWLPWPDERGNPIYDDLTIEIGPDPALQKGAGDHPAPTLG